MNSKIIIYQIFTRLFGNLNRTRKENGSIAENGCGKLNSFDSDVLTQIKEKGVTHVWYTGVIRHATCTDYSIYGIPKQNPYVVKGKAGSPYAISDYYDIDPDLAVDVRNRMGEFEELVRRTHQQGLGVIIDFVPNHVAREYKSITKPKNVKDLGEGDDSSLSFSHNNNFYYSPGKEFLPSFNKGDYYEYPAKATGNDHFDNSPGSNDWYETIKLNYGRDYINGWKDYFDPIPNTWVKMTNILLYWAAKGVDGFRCDMAGMVPVEFWGYAIKAVKKKFSNVLFIAEIYEPNQYANYLNHGFDYLYDKVGMYDCVRDVVCGYRPASSITNQWQATDGIYDHMLYFLENHDEQRIASDFFCKNAFKAVPGVMLLSCMLKNPFMLYAGQEFAERGMDKEGYSGCDGRTTIFDYWSLDSLNHGFFAPDKLTTEERRLSDVYKRILNIVRAEKAISNGVFFDLMYANIQTQNFNQYSHFAFMRQYKDEVLLVILNFGENPVSLNVKIPDHAFEYLGLLEEKVNAIDLLTMEEKVFNLQKNAEYTIDMLPYFGRIYKFYKGKDKMVVFNEHNKEEFPPAHTAEHLLNQLMIRMFGCDRSKNAHIERKKSKITYVLDRKPDRKTEKEIESKMNELIQADLPIVYEVVDRDTLPETISTDRLPEDASEAIRLVRIGDFDVCPCIGKHVRSTSQIGRFELLGTNWNEEEHTYRIRFKIVQ